MLCCVVPCGDVWVLCGYCVFLCGCCMVLCGVVFLLCAAVWSMWFCVVLRDVCGFVYCCER